MELPDIFGPSRRRLWALALGGPLSAMHGEPFDRLASRYSPERCQEILAEWWTITDQSSARWTLDWLRTAGHTAEARTILQELEAGEVAEAPTPQAAFLQRNREEIATRGLLAWDLGRLVPVARWSVNAGYITTEEAWAWVEAGAPLIQSSYASWEEYGNGWRLGYIFWNGGKAPDKLFEQPLGELLKSPGSPWKRLAWQTKL